MLKGAAQRLAHIRSLDLAITQGTSPEKGHFTQFHPHSGLAIRGDSLALSSTAHQWWSWHPNPDWHAHHPTIPLSPDHALLPHSKLLAPLPTTSQPPLLRNNTYDTGLYSVLGICLPEISSFSPHNTLSSYNHSHFTDEETEAQRSETTGTKVTASE